MPLLGVTSVRLNSDIANVSFLANSAVDVQKNARLTHEEETVPCLAALKGFNAYQPVHLSTTSKLPSLGFLLKSDFRFHCYRTPNYRIRGTSPAHRYARGFTIPELVSPQNTLTAHASRSINWRPPLFKKCSIYRGF